jgi:HEPN pEK499 p136
MILVASGNNDLMPDSRQEKALRERSNFDQVTHMMLSASLLGALMDSLLSGHADSTTVRQFCKEWAGTIQSKRFVPFNPGLILGYLYLAILYVQEKWTDAAPDASPTDPTQAAWGLSSARIAAPKNKTPTIRYILRRIRNSLGHARVDIIWPPNLPIADILSKVTLVFHDVNLRDPTDTFEVELNVKDAFQLARKYHVAAGELVANQFGGTVLYDQDWTESSSQEAPKKTDE